LSSVVQSTRHVFSAEDAHGQQELVYGAKENQFLYLFYATRFLRALPDVRFHGLLAKTRCSMFFVALETNTMSQV